MVDYKDLNKEDYEEQECLLCMNKHKSNIPIKRIIERFDNLLSYNKIKEAENHMLYWLNEASSLNDIRSEISISNELMGFYRINGNKEKAKHYANSTLDKCNSEYSDDSLTKGTILLNVATVYKFLGHSENALPLYQKALKIYQNILNANDVKFGGLYNNYGLALVDLKMFDEALEMYDKAIRVTYQNKEYLDSAITYLNIATLYEQKLGLLMAEKYIDENLAKAKDLLDREDINRNGYYAFVCEKCLTVFDYYGYFDYAEKLKERKDKIYARA